MGRGSTASRIPRAWWASGSESVGRATGLRLQRLTPGARALAEAAAVLGPDATRARVVEVAELDHFTGLEAVDTLRRAEILDAGSEVRFRHGVVRASIYDSLPPRSRAGAHVRAARALAEAGARRERTAEHLLQAQRLGEPWALDALREAGRAALAAGRVSSGIAYLRRALDEDPATPARAPSSSRSWARPRPRPGDPAGAARLALAAEDALSGGERARTLERLAGALWLLGQDATAAQAFERALDLAEASGDDAQAARLRAGLLLTARFDPELRVRTIERLAPSLREPGFGRERPPALARLGGLRARPGRPPSRARGRPRGARPRAPAAGARLRARPECFAACCALLWADSLATAEIAPHDGPRGRPPARERRCCGHHVRLPRLDRASARPDIARGGRCARGERRRGRRPLARDTQPGHDPGRDRHGAGQAGRGGAHAPRPRSADLVGGRPAARVPPGCPRPPPPPARRATRRRSRSCSRAAASSSRSGSTTRRCSRGARAPPSPPPAWATAAARMTLADEEVSLARTFGAARPAGRGASRRGPGGSGRTSAWRGFARRSTAWSAHPARSTGRAALIDLGAELRRGGKRREARERLRAGHGPGAALRGLGCSKRVRARS